MNSVNENHIKNIHEEANKQANKSLLVWGAIGAGLALLVYWVVML